MRRKHVLWTAPALLVLSACGTNVSQSSTVARYHPTAASSKATDSRPVVRTVSIQLKKYKDRQAVSTDAPSDNGPDMVPVVWTGNTMIGLFGLMPGTGYWHQVNRTIQSNGTGTLVWTNGSDTLTIAVLTSAGANHTTGSNGTHFSPSASLPSGTTVTHQKGDDYWFEGEYGSTVKLGYVQTSASRPGSEVVTVTGPKVAEASLRVLASDVTLYPPAPPANLSRERLLVQHCPAWQQSLWHQAGSPPIYYSWGQYYFFGNHQEIVLNPVWHGSQPGWLGQPIP